MRVAARIKRECGQRAIWPVAAFGRLVRAQQWRGLVHRHGRLVTRHVHGSATSDGGEPLDCALGSISDRMHERADAA